MQPTIHELAHQAAWEMEGVRRAIVRYEEAEDEADPMTLPPGKALIRGVVGPLKAAIEAQRDEVADTLAAPGRQPLWAWPLQVVDPAKAAVIVLNAAVTAVLVKQCSSAGAPMKTNSVTTTALRIAETLLDQLEYDRWCAAEEQRNAEAKRSKVADHQDRLRALKLRYPNLDRRVWSKWRAKLEIAATVEWSKEECLGLGTMLIALLCKVAPDRFVVEERVLRGGYTQYVLTPTESVLEVMRDVRERALVARPMLMPMLCPPIPWRYEA